MRGGGGDDRWRRRGEGKGEGECSLLGEWCWRGEEEGLTGRMGRGRRAARRKAHAYYSEQ